MPRNAAPLKLEAAAELLSVTQTTGLALGDLDGDGDLDLFVAALTAPCAMFCNNGVSLIASWRQLRPLRFIPCEHAEAAKVSPCSSAPCL
ncbi:MAG: FG-GAP repeat protein [Planctomycetaceae bacterium]|nr:FG-GAP repeat protein [Planctomycetaceae bacterium]